MKLVDDLIRHNIVKSRVVEETLRAVDRGYFYNKSQPHIYADSPQSIGHAATISAPHMHAYALEWLKDFLSPHTNALDIGSGTGYFTVCMSHMMNHTGKVIGIEHIPELVSSSIEHISRYNRQLIGNAIEMHVGDGRLGYPSAAPFKAIHVGAAAPSIPTALIEQLDIGGRMVIPVGPIGQTQYITLVDKLVSGEVKVSRTLAVSYVPLTDKESQLLRK